MWLLPSQFESKWTSRADIEQQQKAAAEVAPVPPEQKKQPIQAIVEALIPFPEAKQR